MISSAGISSCVQTDLLPKRRRHMFTTAAVSSRCDCSNCGLTEPPTGMTHHQTTPLAVSSGAANLCGRSISPLGDSTMRCTAKGMSPWQNADSSAASMSSTSVDVRPHTRNSTQNNPRHDPARVVEAKCNFSKHAARNADASNGTWSTVARKMRCNCHVGANASPPGSASARPASKDSGEDERRSAMSAMALVVLLTKTLSREPRPATISLSKDLARSSAVSPKLLCFDS
mmetsp:Transcript_107334/g.308898  ORF Transcript_107334/g.308898 Transcript_107334/m.308898 type:complete len:230 (-) Transcript_107334:2668-3357(-)